MAEKGYWNYRLITWLLAVGLLVMVPLLAACAGGTTTIPPETVTITPTPTNQQPIEIVSVVGPLPEALVNPGGPLIEITLKNVSDEPIASLTVTLELERDFTFEFDVTSSNPLLPTNSVSTQRRLIGPYGFSRSSSYPLRLEGTMQSGATFAYTKHVMIIES